MWLKYQIYSVVCVVVADFLKPPVVYSSLQAWELKFFRRSILI